MAINHSHSKPTSIAECEHKFTYPADISILKSLREGIPALKECKDYEPDTIDSLMIIITELMTNAIKHGSANLTDAKVSLGVHFHFPRISCIIEDNGPGFERTTVPDPTLPEYIHRDHGRGIFITEQLAKEVIYEHENNTMRILVTLEQH